MSRLPKIEMTRLDAEVHPGNAAVVAKMKEFMCLRGVGTPEMARLAGVGESTLNAYMQGSYHKFTRGSTKYMDSRLWLYLMQNWPRPIPVEPQELLETEGYRQILDCIEDAVETGAISVIYGPPSSEKTFVAEQIVARYQSLGRRDLIRVTCGPNVTQSEILRNIAREASVWVRGRAKHPFIEALIGEFLSRPRPPAIVIDEAQHLSMECLETLRINLHELTRRAGRKGCGLVLMGSHNLYARFKYLADQYSQEQLLSRISHRVQLEGMKEAEVMEIASRALGKDGHRVKISDQQRVGLLEKCRVLDLHATDSEGKRLLGPKGEPVVRTYYSSRRLLEFIRQRKRKNLGSVLVEDVA